MISISLVLLVLLIFTAGVGVLWVWFFKLTGTSSSGMPKSETLKKSKKDDDKTNPDYFFNQGLKDYQKKDYEKALESFRKQEATAPNEQLTFYINKCNDELCSFEDEEQGLGIINEYLCMAHLPNLPKEFNLTVAKAYAKMGEIEKAEEYCYKSLTADAEYVESYKLLGLIQLIKKDFSSTKNTLSTALSLQPNNEEIHEILSYGLCYQVDNCTLKKCREKYHQLMKKMIK